MKRAWFRTGLLCTGLLLVLAALACSGGESPAGFESAGEGEALASGLVIAHVTEGLGASPGATDTVKVHYHGTFEDGTVFDSSIERGQPASFPLNRVIACWTEGLQLMKVGGKAKLVCPADIAYGARGRPPKIPANSTLYFDVELIEIP